MHLKSLLTGALLVLAACDGGTDPDEFGGRYVLRSMDGASLPAPFFPGTSFPHSTVQVREGSLDVGAANEVTIALVTGTEGGPASTVQHSLAFRRQGDSLVVPSHTGSGGRITGKEVRFRTSFPAPPANGLYSVTHDFVFAR